LVAHIRLKNHNPNKLARAEGQSNPTLEDEHGNKYDEVTIRTQLGFEAKPNGAIGRDRYIDLRSDEPRTDVLVFHRPVPGANQLALTLEAERYGGSGKVYFMMVRQDWERKAEVQEVPPTKPEPPASPSKGKGLPAGKGWPGQRK
jgi:hypothetical protein